MLVLYWLDILKLVKVVVRIRLMVILMLFELFAWNRRLLDLFFLTSFKRYSLAHLIEVLLSFSAAAKLAL